MDQFTKLRLCQSYSGFFLYILRQLLLDRNLPLRFIRWFDSHKNCKNHIWWTKNKHRRHCNSELHLTRFSFGKYNLPFLIKIAWKEFRVNIDLFLHYSSLTVVIYNKLFANLLSNSIWKIIYLINISSACLPGLIFLHWKQQRQLGRHSGQRNDYEDLVGLTLQQPRKKHIPQMFKGCKHQGEKQLKVENVNIGLLRQAN